MLYKLQVTTIEPKSKEFHQEVNIASPNGRPIAYREEEELPKGVKGNMLRTQSLHTIIAATPFHVVVLRVGGDSNGEYQFMSGQKVPEDVLREDKELAELDHLLRLTSNMEEEEEFEAENMAFAMFCDVFGYDMV